MNLRRISTRFAIAGVTTAVAASGMVGLATTAADAAEGSAVYDCLAGPSSFEVPVTATGSIPTAVPSGFPVPAGFLPVTLGFTAAEATLTGIKNFTGATQFGAGSTDFKLRMGTTRIPINDVTVPNADIPATGDMTFTTAGSTAGSFVVPKAGTYQVKLPAAFGLVVTTNSATAAFQNLPATCTIKDGETADITTVVVSKQGSTVTAKTPKPVARNKAAKVAVSVKGQYAAPTGKIVAKKGRKVLGTATLKKGKTITSTATVTLKKLKPGKHTIVLTYVGDPSTNKNSDSVKVTVKR